MPLFRGEVDQGIAVKPGDASTGPSPVGIADVGIQILVAREVARLYPGEFVFGEEFVPIFADDMQRIVNDFDISVALSSDRPEAKAFLDLVHDIIASGKELPKTALEEYFPVKKNSWIVDPVDGTARFTHGLDFAILLARVSKGCVTDSWCYFPVQDEMLRRMSRGPISRTSGAPFLIQSHFLSAPDMSRVSILTRTGAPV